MVAPAARPPPDTGMPTCGVIRPAQPVTVVVLATVQDALAVSVGRFVHANCTGNTVRRCDGRK